MLRAVPADMLERANAEEITGFIKQLCMRQCCMSMRVEMTYEIPTRV
jgi:hypothetical protein